MSVRGAAVALALAAACGHRADAPTADPVIIEVRQHGLLGKALPFDDALIAAIRARPEVEAVALAEPLAMPASGRASIGGNDVRFEVGDFADGIDPAYVAGDVSAAFGDWDAAAPAPRACGAGDDPCGDGGASYCDEIDHVCRRRVPVLVSPMAVMLYNRQFARRHGLPAIADPGLQIAGGVVRFEITLGVSTVGATGATALAAPPRKIGAVVVGMSPAARSMGMTVPVGYVRRWMKAYGVEAVPGDERVSLRVRDRAQLDGLTAWLNGRGLSVDGPMLATP